MDTIPLGLGNTTKKSEFSSSSRLLILQSLVPVATNRVSSQLEAFCARLTEALFKISDQTVRPEEATTSFHAYQLLKRNSTTFYRLVGGQINAALAKEVSTVNTRKKSKKEDEKQDFSLVTFEEMESKVLIRNLCQSLEVSNAEQLVALNIRIGHVLRRTPINVSQNPFRPELFVRAVYQAWMEFDTTPESHHLVLRLLQPNLFLQLAPILQEVNEALIARGILPDISESFRKNQRKSEFSRSDDIADRDPYLENKLRNIFSAQSNNQAVFSSSGQSGQTHQAGQTPQTGQAGQSNQTGQSEHAGKEHSLEWTGRETHTAGNVNHAEKITIDRNFFDYLTSIQRNNNLASATGNPDASALRQLSQQATSDSKLTHIDQNTIELLARIFDFVFNDPNIPGDIKGLIGQLQIPTLKVALMDKDFFFKETHPARVLIDTLAKSSILLNAESNSEDPLYQMIEGIVERVQQEFDQQIDLFSDVVSDLETFLKDEEQKIEDAIVQPVANALKQEKMRLAREFAEHDVSLRVETGEVAGFLETFLLEQWIRILTIAHSVKEQKPHALENALKTMDDLIWSLKPKNSAEERKSLVSKLPSMLTLLNAWLNAIKWDEPDRVIFFSKLAERHAAIARAPLEFSPRRQLEIAVNIAQRASERRLNRHVQDQIDQTDDEWVLLLESLERGIWIDFTRSNGSIARFKLAWVSPKRTRYIFTNRQGHDAFSIASEELANKFRNGEALLISADSVVDRALVEALRDPPN
ncbi:DUF1631 family protein [Undibacterium sp. RTI2.1]|uniref:DUF1631 family protein n=1 Tax=unclassified Undibacterium TaxID=2630295 RepID=UPI002AB376F2|nr:MULTISPECIES: DUF1631 family protein [unclassified Undibacterium]MDY7536762.1 DUF1631 family protein [Undibacterium sp. 5I1]MEB0029572.1 DUF1631 family protein [Undibacterium sp. RTI2.1]MEB0115759.1 DUF1631 family protein [Undibacterium sp. RTI2.2]MEB0232940.1 DUF1631 family protein [Undibacterium sp. 10I3]MEB0256644.1 DUF1631 family protein [Undibacterium sp. 5I1]